MDEEKRIILNRIRCLHCDDIIISYTVHDYKSCKCKRISVDGGTQYLRRGFEKASDYEELSLYDDSSFDLIRKYINWGTFGKSGTEPLKFVFLNEMSNSHIENILRRVKTLPEHMNNFMVQELEYRKKHNILIEDN